MKKGGQWVISFCLGDDKNLWGSLAWVTWVKMFIFNFFQLGNAFLSNLNAANLSTSPNIAGYTGFRGVSKYVKYIFWQISMIQLITWRNKIRKWILEKIKSSMI